VTVEAQLGSGASCQDSTAGSGIQAPDAWQAIEASRQRLGSPQPSARKRRTSTWVGHLRGGVPHQGQVRDSRRHLDLEPRLGSTEVPALSDAQLD